MSIKTMQNNIRKLGYQLAVREIYGENTPDYYKLKSQHDSLLDELYKREKRGR